MHQEPACHRTPPSPPAEIPSPARSNPFSSASSPPANTPGSSQSSPGAIHGTSRGASGRLAAGKVGVYEQTDPHQFRRGEGTLPQRAKGAVRTCTTAGFGTAAATTGGTTVPTPAAGTPALEPGGPVPTHTIPHARRRPRDATLGSVFAPRAWRAGRSRATPRILEAVHSSALSRRMLV